MTHDIDDIIAGFKACFTIGVGCKDCPYLADCAEASQNGGHASDGLKADILDILRYAKDAGDPRLLVDPMHLNVFARKLMDMKVGESLHIAKSQDDDHYGVNWYNVTKCATGDDEDETIFEFEYCGSEDYFYAVGTGPEDIMQALLEKGFGAHVFLAKCE